MATREQMLDSLTLDRLRQLADENGVEVDGTRKADYVRAISGSDTPSDDELAEETGEDAESTEDQPEEGEEGTEAPTEEEPVSEFGLLAGDEGVDVDDPRSGRLTRTLSNPGVLISENAADLSAEGTVTEDDELGPLLTIQAWARIAPNIGGDLEQYAGRDVAFMSAPVVPCTDPNCKHSTVGPHVHQPEDTIYTVRTRDQDSAVLMVTLEDLVDIAPDGRVGLPTAG